MKNNREEPHAKKLIARLREFQAYLRANNQELDALPPGAILPYTNYLVETHREQVLEFMHALDQYARFTEQYDYIIECTEIAEAHMAMDTLYQRVGEQHGQALQEQIFQGLSIPPVGVDPETKPEFTKIVLRRLEETLGDEKTIELLSPCLHGRELEPILRDREDFEQLGDLDAFLQQKHKELVARMEQHRREGTLEFAQYVDKDVVEYVANTSTIMPGIREGNHIIMTGIPFQIKKYLTADDPRMKRYYWCYCPWVRGAIKNGEEHTISKHFCHCSAGYGKKYWDIIFNQPSKVEPIETVLHGALVCKFRVSIPDAFQT